MERFRKTGSPAAIRTEAASLRWLAEAESDGGAAVAELLDVGDDWLETRLLPHGSPTPDQAREFGRRLARTHAAGSRFWGEVPPGLEPADARLAELPAPAVATPHWDTWGEFYAEARLLPYLEAARLAPDQHRVLARAVDRIGSGHFDAPQPGLVDGVARLHGDLWGGNVIWPAGRGTLIDPSAHGGHAETDLAELHLFGAPHLECVLAGYQEVSPLADGWHGRIGLHQFHMVLVHVALFGISYLDRALDIADELTA